MFDLFWFKKKADRPSVLVVDDEPNIVETLQDRLEMNDYQVFTACNGRDGLEKALKHKPDVILLDIIMPIMDGLEMLEALRENEQADDISVIMLTACSQTQDISRAKSCRIEDYIVKPFDLGELLKKIELIMDRKRVAV